ARDRLRAAFDRALAAAAGLRRSTPRDLAALADALGTDATEVILKALYRYWWRVETVGLERVPASGRVILVANRGGALVPYEALMIREAVRRARPLLDDWMAELPLLGAVLARAGGVRAAPATVRRLLARGAAVIACPESNHPKPFRERYRLGRFGRGMFARLAITTGTPIVPVAVIGAEEVHPVLARLDLPGRLLGLPTLPLTPTFPWLGLWGLVPLPTKWALLFGEPLEVAARRASAGSATRCASACRRSSSRACDAGARSSSASSGCPSSSRSIRGPRGRPCSCSTARGAWSGAPTRSSRSTTRSRAGSSTM